MQIITRVDAKAQGLKRFFTSVACKQGHVSERLVSTGHCWACQTEHNQKPEVKAKKAEHNQKPEVKAKKAAYNQKSERKARAAAREQTPEQKEKRLAYRQTPEAKAKRALRLQTPEARAQVAALRQTPEARAKASECSAAWYAVNNERARVDKARWKAENPHVLAALCAQRRAAKLERTPKWLTPADKAAIKAIYEQANFMSSFFEIAFHVDHIIPLQGETVSGLHCPTNLQILTATENLTKSNKLPEQLA